MATKATLESANVALKAQNDELMRRLEALEQKGAKTAEPKAPEIPHVQRGYKMRQNELGKWIPDETKPRIEIRGGCKQNMTEETFVALFITHHTRLVKEFKALAPSV